MLRSIIYIIHICIYNVKEYIHIYLYKHLFENMKKQAVRELKHRRASVLS